MSQCKFEQVLDEYVRCPFTHQHAGTGAALWEIHIWTFLWGEAHLGGNVRELCWMLSENYVECCQLENYVECYQRIMLNFNVIS